MPAEQGDGRIDFGQDEGWYTDPYGRHEARWMSLGTPTALVRDGGVESQDPPPATPPTIEPVRIPAEAQGSVGADDLKRADHAENEPIDPDKLQQRFLDAAEEGIGGTGPVI
jgi:hypothetical protein